MQSPPPPRNPDAVLRRLEWTVMRRLDGLLHGDYRTLFRGFGLDLADLREYQYGDDVRQDRKSTRLNSSHTVISYAVFCLKKKNKKNTNRIIKQIKTNRKNETVRTTGKQ